MAIIFLENQKRIKKFCDKVDLKEWKFFSISDDLVASDFPKKAKIEDCSSLLPPPDIVTKYIKTENKKEFQERYYRYLSKPYSRLLINRIISFDVNTDKNAAICFGDMEKDIHIHKYIKNIVDTIYSPYSKSFSFKDFEKNQNILRFRYDDINSLKRDINEDYKDIIYKIKELESCNDGFIHNQFYDGGK